MNYNDLITIEPGKRSGKPCIRGLRITVYDILEYLAGGMSEVEILEDFSELTADDIRACLMFAWLGMRMLWRSHNLQNVKKKVFWFWLERKPIALQSKIDRFSFLTVGEAYALAEAFRNGNRSLQFLQA